MKMDYYAEFEGLFVEHELDDNTIKIVNIQLPDPRDPENTDKWIDLTDRVSDSVITQLTSQIEEWYIDNAGDDGRGDYLYQLRRDEREG